MPHALKQRDGQPTTFFYTAWQESPFSDAALGRLASSAIDGMKLGQGTTTDFLAVSFSALDIVGHDFGPGVTRSRTCCCTSMKSSASCSISSTNASDATNTVARLHPPITESP